LRHGIEVPLSKIGVRVGSWREIAEARRGFIADVGEEIRSSNSRILKIEKSGALDRRVSAQCPACMVHRRCTRISLMAAVRRRLFVGRVDADGKYRRLVACLAYQLAGSIDYRIEDAIVKVLDFFQNVHA
jgi:hypothetical protein